MTQLKNGWSPASFIPIITESEPCIFTAAGENVEEN
jgi:hypothetical protein